MRARVLTALILIPVVLAILMSASPFPILGLAALVGGAGYQELSALGGMSRSPFPFLALVATVVFGSLALDGASVLSLALLLALTVFGLGTAPSWVATRGRFMLEISSLWCVCPLLAVAILHTIYAPNSGFWAPATPLLVIVVPLWIGDSLAYFVGKSIGKHLLAPRISPKKTIEGAIANLVGCVGGAVAIGVAISMPVWVSGVCGLLAGILGQAGDLAESAMKRGAGFKDTGRLLPGHGGVLDRIDSLLLTAPAQALFLALALPPHVNR